MLTHLPLLTLGLAVALLASGCTSPTNKAAHDYPITGKVTDIAADKSKVKIDHEEIPGLMKAIEMPFKLAGPDLVKDIKVGDQVKGTLRVDGGYTITALNKIQTVAK